MASSTPAPGFEPAFAALSLSDDEDDDGDDGDDGDTSPTLDLLKHRDPLPRGGAEEADSAAAAAAAAGAEKELHELSAAAEMSSATEGKATGGSVTGGSPPRLSTGSRIPAPRVAVEPPAPVAAVAEPAAARPQAAPTPAPGVTVARRVIARWRAFVAERTACPFLDMLHRFPDFFKMEVLGRGLSSFTSQLNFSAFYGIGGAHRDCVSRVKGVSGGV
jgi:hypothetical protein